jgi:hypothetical protein
METRHLPKQSESEIRRVIEALTLKNGSNLIPFPEFKKSVTETHADPYVQGESYETTPFDVPLNEEEMILALQAFFDKIIELGGSDPKIVEVDVNIDRDGVDNFKNRTVKKRFVLTIKN